MVPSIGSMTHWRCECPVVPCSSPMTASRERTRAERAAQALLDREVGLGDRGEVRLAHHVQVERLEARAASASPRRRPARGRGGGRRCSRVTRASACRQASGAGTSTNVRRVASPSLDRLRRGDQRRPPAPPGRARRGGLRPARRPLRHRVRRAARLALGVAVAARRGDRHRRRHRLRRHAERTEPRREPRSRRAARGADPPGARHAAAQHPDRLHRGRRAGRVAARGAERPEVRQGRAPQPGRAGSTW